MCKRIFASIVCALPLAAAAQTVTVDATNASPNNTTTFNSVMMAIHSFQASGKITASTDGSGVGLNHANAAANVINVLNTGIYDEVVRFDERVASTEQTVQDQDLTIQGPGAGAAPSAANNAVIAIKDDGANSDDGFEVRTGINLTIKNISFIPSWDAPPAPSGGNDLVMPNPQTVGAATNNLTFKSCTITPYNASHLPVASSKAEAYVDQSANVATPATDLDDAVNINSAVNANENLTFEDCIIGQLKKLGDGSKGHDGIVLNEGNNTAGPGFQLNLNSTVITHCERMGWQIASGSTTNPSFSTYNVTGTSVTAGLATGLGGPTVIDDNGLTLTLTNHGIADLAGTARCVANFSNLIVANNFDRQMSMSAKSQLSLTDCLIQGRIPVVYQHDSASVSKTWQHVTLRRVGADSLFGAQAGATAVLTVRDAIFAGDGSGTAIGVFGTGDMAIDVDFSATALSGPNALTARGGTTATTFGANVIDADPAFVSTDYTNSSFLDVSACAYTGKGTGGSNLRGGADFVATCAGINDWSVY